MKCLRMVFDTMLGIEKNNYMKYTGNRILTQEVFNDQPKEVNWCGVDYDGLLSYGTFRNPRYTYASERWRGFDLIGNTIENSGYKALTSLRRVQLCLTILRIREGFKMCEGLFSKSLELKILGFCALARMEI